VDGMVEEYFMPEGEPSIPPDAFDEEDDDEE
jgi:hypothetical protein